MRRLLTVCLLALPAAASASNLPSKINFQGKLVHPVTGEPRNGPVSMTFRLYDAPTNGALLYTEPQSNVPVANGVFSVQIGTVTGLFPKLFQGASAYLSVQVSPDALEMEPRQQLNMSAYAFTAMQLVADGAAAVRVDNAYSTFTSAGHLLLAGGVQGSSGSFANGVTASSGTFTATGATQYSLATSSGLLVAGGTLRAEGAGGVEVVNGVKAATFTGDGADVANARPEVSSDTAINSFITPAATEVMVSSASVTPSRANSRFVIFGALGMNRANNNLATWTLRVRRAVAADCTTASTQVGTAFNHTVPNTAGMSNVTTYFNVDAPNTVSVVSYCLTVSASGAQTMDERSIVVMELAP